MRIRLFAACVAAALLIAAVAAAPALAVIDGQKDVGNTYSNVGMIAVEVEEGIWGHGTCTLVADDVILTAAHNVSGWDFDSMRVSFAANATELDPDGADFYAVDDVKIIPGYDPDSLVGVKDDSKRALLRDDLALVRLTQSPNIEPAKIVGPEHWLDTIDLKTASFTIVGYGTTGFVAGSALSWKNPNTQMLFDGRYSKAVRAINNSEVYAERYLKTSTGTSFGDSGGPLFFGHTLVGESVWGESMRCVSPAYEYRLDSRAAQEFLRENLSTDCFVTPQ